MTKKIIIEINNGLVDTVHSNFIEEKIEIEVIDSNIDQMDDSDTYEYNQELFDEIENEGFNKIYG